MLFVIIIYKNIYNYLFINSLKKYDLKKPLTPFQKVLKDLKKIKNNNNGTIKIKQDIFINKNKKFLFTKGFKQVHYSNTLTNLLYVVGFNKNSGLTDRYI